MSIVAVRRAREAAAARQFLRAGRRSGRIFFQKCAATQEAELAECARPAAVTPSGRRMATPIRDGGESENTSGRYFGRADRRYWIRRGGYLAKLTCMCTFTSFVRQAVAQKARKQLQNGKIKEKSRGYGY